MSTPPLGIQGWGKAKWGTSPWGSGQETFGLPVIIPIAPLANETGVPPSRPICIRITDNSGITQGTLRITVGPVIFVLGGSAQNGATMVLEGNDENGFDIELRLPDPYPLGSRQEVTVSITDTLDNTVDRAYFFIVGVGPRLVSVSNPAPGILLAHFNEAIRRDGAFLSAPSWKVSAVTAGAADVTVTEVFGSAGNANTAVLRHTGGGSIYELVVLGILSQDGDPLEIGQNSAVFELVFGEEEDPTIRLFNTVFGPVGISQRTRLRRTVDEHVINRSIALGMDEQFRLRFQALDGTAGRDGRPGVRRT